MTRSEKKRIKTLTKSDLLKETLSLATKVNKMENETQKITAVQAEANDLRSKIVRIGQAITERFDADGIDDITLPSGNNIITLLWWGITNASSLLKLIREVISIVKESDATPSTQRDKVIPA